MPRLKRAHYEIGAVLAAVAALALMATQLPGATGLLLGNGMPVFGDFIAFWSAGRLALEGHVELVHDAQAIMAAHREAVPGHEAFFPWRSPPVFLLIMTPLAALPFWAAALVFLGASLCIYTYALTRFLPDRRALLFALTPPALIFHIGSVQMTPLITGLHGLAFHWLTRRPIAAGAAIAAMAIKPHLAVMWPILLVCQGRWRTFLSAAAFTLGLLFVTGVIFGFEVYPRFLADLGDAQGLMSRRGLPPNTVGSLYGNLVYLGVMPNLAFGLHVVSALAAIAVAARIFLRQDEMQAMAALPAATVLISPYLFFYDTLLLSLSVVALARGTLKPHEIAIFCFAFLVGGLALAVGYVFTPPLCWAACWSMLALTFFRPVESAAPRPA